MSAVVLVGVVAWHVVLRMPWQTLAVRVGLLWAVAGRCFSIVHATVREYVC